MQLIGNLKITYVKNKLMQQKNTSDKQIKNFNVQNNNLHKQVALHHIVFIRSLHQSDSNIIYKLCDYKKKKTLFQAYLTLIQNRYLRDICATHAQDVRDGFDKNYDKHAWCRN